MSAISTILARLRSAIWAIDVRDDIADAIEQCYSDVSNPTLQTDALEAAIQEKIDEGEMAALTIGDGTITAAKLAANAVTTPKIADGSITQAKLDPNIDFVQVDDTLSQTGEAADAAAVGAAIDELNGSLNPYYNRRVSLDIFEIGAISITKNGWTYSSSAARIRTKENTTVHLDKGDVVGLLDYSDAMFYIGGTSDNGETYFFSGWRDQDFCANESGEFVLVVRNKTEKVQSSVNELGSLVFKSPKDNTKSLCSYNLDKEGYTVNAPTYTIAYSTVKYQKERSTDYIEVSPNTEYVYECLLHRVIDENLAIEPWLGITWYDAEKNRLGAGMEAYKDWKYGGTATSTPERRALVDIGDDNFRIFAKTKSPATAKYVALSGRTYGCAGFSFVEASKYNRSLAEEALLRSIEDRNILKSYFNGMRLKPEYLSDNKKDIIKKGVLHRGYTPTHPENTIPALVEAKRQGFYFVETDISKTSDGVYVMLHDESINRTARNPDGSAISSTVKIQNTTYADLLLYDFGIYKGSAFAGTKIPTLQEWLSACLKLGVHPYLELKRNISISDIDNIINAVHDAGLKGKVTYIGYDITQLIVIVESDPCARVGLLINGAGNETTLASMFCIDGGIGNCFLAASSYSGDSSYQLYKTNNREIEVGLIDTENDILDVPDYITGVFSNTLHAGEVIYNSMVN